MASTSVLPAAGLGHAVDLLAYIVLLIVGYFAFTVMPKAPSFFVERDPSLSFPLSDEAVSDLGLVGLAAGIPFLVIGGVVLTYVAVGAYPWCSRATGKVNLIEGAASSSLPSSHSYSLPRVIRDPFVPLLATTASLVVTLFLTGVFKLFFHRYRPHFFAVCNYKGYGDALVSGNFTAYLAATTPGLPGSFDDCLVKVEIEDVMFSSPSGHTSMMTAGMLSLSIFLYLLYVDIEVVHRAVQRVGVAVPMALTLMGPSLAVGLVAGTRARDYWHRVEDLIFGFVLGTVVTLALHVMYFRETFLLAGVGEKKGRTTSESLPHQEDSSSSSSD